jgi:hypothetical protein
MDAIEALHNAARSYCIDQYRQWSQQYARLTATDGERMKFRDGQIEYSDAAWDLIPRYRVLDAIRRDVERFVPRDFPTAEALRVALAEIGETAPVEVTRFEHPVAARAEADERRRFVEFVGAADLNELARRPPLPFRRVLREDEHALLHEAFIRRWGKWYGGAVDGVPADAVTLHEAAMEAPGAYEHLCKTLADRGVSRLFELREWGDGYELDTAAAGFTYTGAEGFWTSGEMAWMVYASHESSITFGGGWLVAAVRSVLPEFDRYRYRGWDLAAYE